VGVGDGVGDAEGFALGPPMTLGNTIAAHAVSPTAMTIPRAMSSFFFTRVLFLSAV
jgi:hypothetical protein